MELTKEQKEVLEFAEVKLGKASQISDGYHTFEQVYIYRMLYNAGMISLLDNNQLGIRIEKSKRHHDGELCFGGGYFIVTISGPYGQISNHYKLEHWDLFACREVETPSEPWDGHTPDIAEERLKVLVSKIAEYTKPNLRRSGRTTKIAEDAANWLLTKGNTEEGTQKVLVFPLTSFNESSSLNYDLIISETVGFTKKPSSAVIYDHFFRENPRSFKRGITEDLVKLVCKILTEKNTKPLLSSVNLAGTPAILITL